MTERVIDRDGDIWEQGEDGGYELVETDMDPDTPGLYAATRAELAREYGPLTDLVPAESTYVTREELADLLEEFADHAWHDATAVTMRDWADRWARTLRGSCG